MAHEDTALIKRIVRKAHSFYKLLTEKSKNHWRLTDLEAGVKAGYKYNFGMELDLAEPTTFTEKIQWYKLYYDNLVLNECVDKYRFKEYIKNQLGEGIYTIPIFGVWDNIGDLMRDWDSLPEELVLKSTVQSDGNFIKLIHHRSAVNKAALRKECKAWFKTKNTLINSYCRAYYGLKPRIIAEKYEKEIGDQLYDYKVFCFGGQPFCVYVAEDHFKDSVNGKDYPISFFDLDWNLMNVSYGEHAVKQVHKPERFDEMIELSKKLSEDFPFVRVDFFQTSERLYIAEMTFYPGGGFVPYHPQEFDQQMGELFALPL